MVELLGAVWWLLGVIRWLLELGRSKEGDEYDTYPLHFMDQMAAIRGLITSYMFRYDCVLDAEELHDSLTRLLQLRDWKKFSGRLRGSNNGRLVIRVYRDMKRQSLCRFSHVSYGVSVHEHSLGRRLPRQTGPTPSIQDGFDTFREFSVPPDMPGDVKHYLTTDEPLLSLRIVSFTDATLVSITFPHVVMDAMGVADFLGAWSAMLQQRVDQVPPLLGVKEDVMASVGSRGDAKAQSSHILERWQLRGLALVAFILQITWDRFTERGIQEGTIYLPVEFVAELRQSAHSEHRREHGMDPPFLSDGDLIAAWGAQMILSSRANKEKSAMICNMFNIRSRVKDVLRSPGVYLQNLVLPTTVNMNIQPTQGHPGISVGIIACLIRDAISEQVTDGQIHRLMRIMRAAHARTGLMPFFGMADSTIITCTNWSKARLQEAAYFAPAVRSSSESGGACVASAGTVLNTSGALRDMLIIYGKDAIGNYWVHGHLRRETWTLIQNVFDDRSSRTV
ncbi:hypothetical protein BDV25DRAFT_140061 [Aspergillus avenaceus]|uniref:Transferase family-domain-containing protein n=1 Tax=Aspergillus avenaceus TaxID=36643 RepID=A0A5N6TV33_ASPAV|nr:hypothetical protein BDV25DRAFT_140061 [Aspergillus avenaceus]